MLRTIVFTRCEDKVYHLLDQDQDYVTKDPVLMLHNGTQYLNIHGQSSTFNWSSSFEKGDELNVMTQCKDKSQAKELKSRKMKVYH